MSLIKKILIIFFFLLPISNSFGAMLTFVDRTLVAKDDSTSVDDSGDHITGIHFNDDGTKMFVSYHDDFDDTYNHVSEYNLATPFDVSTSSYAGDDERCTLNTSDTSYGPIDRIFDLEFSNDGMKLFVARGNVSNNANDDRVFGFDLTSPYDISTCSFGTNQTSNLDSDGLRGSVAEGKREDTNLTKYRIQNIEFNNDGTKFFAIFMGQGSTAGSDARKTRLLEYTLSSPYDLTTLTLVTDAGMELEDEMDNPMGMRFSPDGKRLVVVDHTERLVTQISLDVAFSTSSFTIDGQVNILNLNGTNSFDEPRGIAFSASGLKLYIGTDRVNAGDAIAGDRVNEIDLACPFNIIAGKCPSITENSERTGMAEAQIELARRTIERSTNSTLNRLKWIRRNKDKQNLTNLNINLNFSNQILASLTEVVRTSAAKKNTKDKKQDVFYWSEGSIAVGRMGDTSISSSKEIETNSLTLGADKFTENNGIVGLAFRYGRDNTDVGDAGSNLDGDTYNLTFYNTRPSEIDTKYIDTIIGIGKIKTDILTVMDGKHLTANRRGKQIYGTVKLKDEIKKNKLTIIPSSQIDFGHTILNAYDEVGTGAISVEKQHVKTRHLRATVAAVHDLEDEKYSIKRHGKLEYQANLKRSSNLKYTYVSDSSKAFKTKLSPAAFHNINGEIGIDIVFPENYSIFIIYERNQALDYGHTDNIHIALGYLPNKDTEYAFKINGSENLMSKFEIKKDINGFNLSFNLNDDLTNIGNAREANIELNKVF